MIIIISVFLLSIQSEVGAIFFAFFQGLMLDVLAGGPSGFFPFLYVLVFIIIKLLSYPLDLLSIVGRLAVIFIAVMFKNICMVILLKLFSFEAFFSYNEFMVFILSALLTVFAALFLLGLLDTLHSRYSQTESRM